MYKLKVVLKGLPVCLLSLIISCTDGLGQFATLSINSIDRNSLRAGSKVTNPPEGITQVDVRVADQNGLLITTADLLNMAPASFFKRKETVIPTFGV